MVSGSRRVYSHAEESYRSSGHLEIIPQKFHDNSAPGGAPRRMVKVSDWYLPLLWAFTPECKVSRVEACAGAGGHEGRRTGQAEENIVWKWREKQFVDQVQKCSGNGEDENLREEGKAI